MITLCSIKGISYQESDSLLAGGESVKVDALLSILNLTSSYSQSDKLSSGYSAKSLAQQSAKTLADVSAKIYANQSPKFTGNQSAKHFANLKRGEFTPFAKGDFSHLSKEENYPHWQGLFGITTRGRIEFCQSIKKGSQSATLGNVDIKYRASENINISLLLWYGKYQPFGSMPRDCNSLRSILLIQVANVASPSFFISASSCSLNSGVNLIWYCGDLFSFPVDMVITLIYYILHGNDHVTIIYANKAMPRSASTLTGHLITTDNETIEVTMSKHNTFMYQGKRVVTFAMIDEVHQRPKGTAKRTFNTHKKHFIDGVDYFLLTKYVIRTELPELEIGGKAKELMLITESGYLMVAKPFTDDLSWQVQRSMVNSYFRLSEFPEIKHIQIPTLAELEAMPIGEAQNLISRLEADSYQGHGRRGSYAMNLRRKEKKALKPMVIAIEQASQLHIQDMGDYRS